jgi:hypothetical protein
MRRLLPGPLFCAALVAAGPALADNCPRDTLAAFPEQLNDGGTAVAYKTNPARIEVGKPFSIDVVACVDGEKRMAPSRIRVDAGMPMHGHGMNYTPSERKIGPGHSSFDGMVFHMPGHWQITFDVYEGDKRQRLTQKTSVKR